VAQRFVEMIVGRLVTDSQFREMFSSDPHRTLGELLERGTHLTAVEIAALIATDSRVWKEVAVRLDARLLQQSIPRDETP
jgi:hypothetical protein